MFHFDLATGIARPTTRVRVQITLPVVVAGHISQRCVMNMIGLKTDLHLLQFSYIPLFLLLGGRSRLPPIGLTPRGVGYE
jgi:hypothetical protein